jgi:hypothetical protein
MHALALTLALLAAVAPPQNTTQKAAQSPAQTSAQNTGFIFWNMSRHSIDFLLRSVPQTTSLRLAQLKQTFTDLQCSHLREQPLTEGQNLLCTLPGTASSTLPPLRTGLPARSDPEFGTILFLAHYEHEGPGQSAVDNWSGAIMLPFLYHALVAEPRHHTFLFAEVDGEAGAKALFNSFTPEERRAIKGVVALNSLGLGPAQFYSDANDTNGMRLIDTSSITRADQIHNACAFFPLCNALLGAANDLRAPAPAYAIPGGWLKIDDTLEFRHHSIPSILIHSVNFGTRNLPGSDRDTPSVIDSDSYFNTFVLLSYYAAELDKAWPVSVNEPASAPSRGRRR